MSAARVTSFALPAAIAAAAVTLALGDPLAAPGALRLAAAALVLGGGAALPWLLRAAPREPSALKVAAFAALLSAPLVALLLVAARSAGLPARPAALACVALSQLLALGRPIGLERPGRAALVALALAAGLGVAVALALFAGGGAPLLGRAEVLWHAGVADEVLRRGFALGLEHPWLAGAPLPASPAVAYPVAAVADLAGVATTQALGALTVLSAALTPVLAYLAAAAVWRRPWADLGAVAFTLVGWNALGGWRAPSPAGAPAGPGGWAVELARATPGSVPGAVHYGGSAWLVPGATPLALALALGALAAGVHAVRHGARPWPGLAAACAGLAALVHPALGTATAAALILVAVALGGTPRARLATAVGSASALLPAVVLVARHGVGPDPVTPALGSAGSGALIGAGAPLAALGAAALVRGLRGPAAAERRAPLALLGAAAAAAVVLAAALDARGRDLADLGALAALALAVLAGGAAPGGERRPRRALPASLPMTLLACAVLFGGARAAAHAVRAHAALARAGAPLVVDGRRIAPRATSALEEDLAGCLAWVADRTDLRRRGAVLVAFGELGERRAGGATAPSAAPLAAGLPLYWDAPSGLVPPGGRSAAGDDWATRGRLLTSLYTERDNWDPNIRRVLAVLGRPLVFLVDERHRRATTERGVGPRGIDMRLLQLGAREVHAEGDASVLLLEPEALR